MKNMPDSVFKPKPNSSELKSDLTSRAAREILEGEKAAREAKTERLRQARLAQETIEAAKTPAKPATAGRKRRAARA
ncbi:hypothetical protein [Mesorhizobium sp. 1M-11]|uniref:hypothetical protein n=1 Tax=Mesorhizobium sp. 1M-11 TaxID=1529006 RepID=UPI0006C75CE1|nr:hypothetical protein [Mesorhizobium sp. 1M-11]